MNSAIKKNWFALLVFICFAIFCPAQKKSSFFIEAKGGLSLPVGGFANKQFGNDFLGNADGLAKMGFAHGAAVGYQISIPVAAVVSFGYSMNKQDAASFDAYLKSRLGSNTTTNVTTNSWDVLKIMAGIDYGITISPTSRLSLSIRAQAGVCKTGIPGYKYVYSTGTEPNTQIGSAFFSKITLPWTFCYTTGANLKYKLDRKLYLLSECSYFKSKPFYRVTYIQVMPGGGINSIVMNKKMSLSAVLISAGVGIEL